VPGRHRLTTLFAGEAVVLGASGIALLVAPDTMVDAWPWALTPLLARVYAAFFLAFAVGAALAAYERRVAAVRPFLIGSVVLVAGTLTASLAHLSSFDHGPGRWLWFVSHVVAIALLAAGIVSLSRGAGRPRALTAAEP